MANIPLPALGIQAPPQPDILGQVAKMRQIQGMGQEQQLRGQQIQAGQLENQMRQRELQDQQTTQQVLGAHGGDLDSALPELAGKVTAKTFLALQKASQDHRKEVQAYSDKDLDIKLKKDNLMLGLIGDASKLPPDQYQSMFPAIAQKALEIDPSIKGHIDPSQPIPPDQLQQLGLLYQTQTSSLAKEAAKRAQAEEDRKAALAPSQLAESQAAAKIKENQAANGGGIPVDQRELADYLKNPKLDKGVQKDAATFAAWKAKQSPTALTLNNMLGSGGQGSAVDQAAQRYLQTGELPAGFTRSPGTTAAIINRAAALDPNANIAANKSTFSADSAALKKVQSTYDQMNAFEGTALKNLDLYVQKAKAIPDLGAKFANVPLRKLTGDMIGSRAMAEMEIARHTAASEAAKVLNSATGSGVLSDTQKKDILDVVNGNLPLDATIGVVETLKQDMGNRHQSYLDDINAIKGRMGAKQQPPSPAGGAAPTGGDFFSQFGGKSKQ